MVPERLSFALQPGAHKLLARATDDKGATQPEKRDSDRRTYMINHLVPAEVLVKGKEFSVVKKRENYHKLVEGEVIQEIVG